MYNIIHNLEWKWRLNYMDGTAKAGLGTEVMSSHILADFNHAGKS